MQVEAKLSESEILDLVTADFRRKFKLSKAHKVNVFLSVRSFVIEGDDASDEGPQVHFEVSARTSFDDGKTSG